MDGKTVAAFALAAAALAAGCGKEDASRVSDAGTKVGEAVKHAGEAITGAVSVEPVDFRALKEVMPDTLAGLKRKSADGSRTKVMGIASSKAEAAYEDGRGGRIALTITDAGTFTGLASMAVSWISVEIDKEGDSGYERTTTLEGRKAYERYEKATRTGRLDVVVAGRFLVAAEAKGVEMKTFREAVARLDLAKLEALKVKSASAGK